MAFPNQRQALQEAKDYFQANDEARICLELRARINVFQRGIDLQLHPWKVTSSNSLVCVRLNTHSHIVGSNLQVSMLKETLGIGPRRYCIVVDSNDPRFYQHLKLLLYCLPEEKMFLYSSGSELRGPFLYKPWLSRGRRLCASSSLTFNEFHDNFDEGCLDSLQPSRRLDLASAYIPPM